MSRPFPSLDAGAVTETGEAAPAPGPGGRPPFARWLADTNDITRLFLAAGGRPGLINMAGGLPAPELYPAGEMAEIARQAVAGHPAEVLGYGQIEGLPQLRDALAERFAAPGLRLGRENVLITSGGMQGLDLVGKVLLDREGDLVAAQSPTYLGALDAWKPRRPAYRPIRLEEEGFDPLAALEGARFAYTVPNFSNPTGRLVPLAERRALVEAAHRTGTWLVEDDPYGGLHYDGETLPRMIELSGASRPAAVYDGPVVYMGTVSKELAPGLRVGWVVAAPEMIAALAAAKQGGDMCTSGLTQRIVLDAFAQGLAARLQPRLLAVYRERRDALCAALETHLAARFTWTVPAGGMFVWAVARDASLDTDALAREGLDAGVCVSPGSVFDPAGLDRRAIRINFTYNPPDRLAEGVRRLAGLFQARG